MKNKDILVIGAGVTGMEASLLLAEAGHRVYLVDKEPLIGGQTIKYEEVFPNMECSTCMVAPKQQEVLQNDSIELLLLSEIEHVKGKAGEFSVKIKKKARYVSLTSCIGCGVCYDPCPVSIDNDFEECLSQKKAIAVPCPGALPNIPAINPETCLRLNGKKKECQACKEACMFDAIDFSEKDELIEVNVGAILVATGFELLDVEELTRFGYEKSNNIYTAFEFERLNAANGPTEGKITLRDGETPKSIGIIHCVGRSERGYCSGVCCMYSAKFSHYLKHKIPEAKIHEFYSDLCIPGKANQEFYQKTIDKGVTFTCFKEIDVEGKNGTLTITYENGDGKKNRVKTDMIILSPAMIPRKTAENLGKTLGLTQDKRGFFSTQTENLSPVTTGTEGIYVAGCAEGPKDIPYSISEAEAAAGKIIALLG